MNPRNTLKLTNCSSQLNYLRAKPSLVRKHLTWNSGGFCQPRRHILLQKFSPRGSPAGADVRCPPWLSSSSQFKSGMVPVETTNMAVQFTRRCHDDEGPQAVARCSSNTSSPAPSCRNSRTTGAPDCKAAVAAACICVATPCTGGNR